MTNTPAGQALKPCPFCGGNDIEYSSLRLCFVCEVCNAEGPISEGYNHDAKNKWNARHTADIASSEGDAALRSLESIRRVIEALMQCSYGSTDFDVVKKALTRPATAPMDEWEEPPACETCGDKQFQPALEGGWECARCAEGLPPLKRYFSDRDLEILRETLVRYRKWVLDKSTMFTADDSYLIQRCIEAVLETPSILINDKTEMDIIKRYRANKSKPRQPNPFLDEIPEVALPETTPLAEQPDIGAMLEKMKRPFLTPQKMADRCFDSGWNAALDTIAQAMKGQTK